VPGRDKADEMGEIARALEAIKTSVAARAEGPGRSAWRAAADRRRAGRRPCRLRAKGACPIGSMIHSRPITNSCIDFNQSMESVADALRQVTQAAQAVRVGASEIASASGDLSSRTENQAAALEESAAAVRELSTTVAQTAQTAKEASDSAPDPPRARASGETMTQAVAAMEEIAKSSNRMQEIVALIEGSRSRPTCWRSTPGSKRRGRVTPARALPWSPAKCAAWRSARPKRPRTSPRSSARATATWATACR
jgi:methyl-accepting chemotaxis protein